MGRMRPTIPRMECGRQYRRRRCRNSRSSPTTTQPSMVGHREAWSTSSRARDRTSSTAMCMATCGIESFRRSTKVVFNVFGMMANASALCYATYHSLDAVMVAKPVLLMVAALIFFLANTLPVSVVIALTEKKSVRRIWSECYFWSFPYYMVGAAAVGLVGVINRHAGWQTSLLVLPLIYWVYRSYRLYLARLEAQKDRVEIEKQHVEEIASLNMRTIEALALAIEAKDHTTHTHLQRVRTY